MILHLIEKPDKFQSKFIRFDRTREVWIEYVHVGILEPWIAGLGCGPGSENHLLNSISIQYESRGILDSWLWNGFWST